MKRLCYGLITVNTPESFTFPVSIISIKEHKRDGGLIFNPSDLVPGINRDGHYRAY